MIGFDTYSLPGWLILATTAALSFVHSVLWLWVCIPVALWKAATLWIFYGRPWSRIHYPAMRMYSRVSLIEFATSQSRGEEFDVTRAVSSLVQMIHPEWSEGQVATFVDRELERYRTKADREPVELRLRQRSNRRPPEEIASDLDTLLPILYEKDRNTMIVRLAIAGLVEQEYGVDQRAEYVDAVFAGRAK